MKTLLFSKLLIPLIALLFWGCKNQNNTPEDKLLSTEEAVEIRIPETVKAYYKSIDFSQSSTELYDDLAALTIGNHSQILSYNERHKYLYKVDADPQNSDSVVMVYSGEKRYYKEYLSGSNSYKPQTFNTEHTYPQSKIENTAKGDLHHLRVCDVKVNAKRANYPYTEGKGSYRLNKRAWYPGDQWKGDVARMLLYMNLRYAENFEDVGSLDLFLKWNAEDPVSEFERARNNRIAKIQGNRNPFIDNPYLATQIWGGPSAENTWE